MFICICLFTPRTCYFREKEHNVIFAQSGTSVKKPFERLDMIRLNSVLDLNLLDLVMKNPFERLDMLPLYSALNLNIFLWLQLYVNCLGNNLKLLQVIFVLLDKLLRRNNGWMVWPMRCRHKSKKNGISHLIFAHISSISMNLPLKPL
jgi:hypothetical protein